MRACIRVVAPCQCCGGCNSPATPLLIVAVLLVMQGRGPAARRAALLADMVNAAAEEAVAEPAMCVGACAVARANAAGILPVGWPMTVQQLRLKPGSRHAAICMAQRQAFWFAIRLDATEYQRPLLQPGNLAGTVQDQQHRAQAKLLAVTTASTRIWTGATHTPPHLQDKFKLGWRWRSTGFPMENQDPNVHGAVTCGRDDRHHSEHVIKWHREQQRPQGSRGRSNAASLVDPALRQLNDDPRAQPGAARGKAQLHRGGGRNTASFDPSSTLVRPDMRVLVGPNRPVLDRPLKHDDVVVVPEVRGAAATCAGSYHVASQHTLVACAA